MMIHTHQTSLLANLRKAIQEEAHNNEWKKPDPEYEVDTVIPSNQKQGLTNNFDPYNREYPLFYVEDFDRPRSPHRARDAPRHNSRYSPGRLPGVGGMRHATQALGTPRAWARRFRILHRRR